MSLDTIISVQIDRTTTTPTQAGFGTPLIAGYFPTSIFPERVRSFTSLVDMAEVGFASTDPVYIAASDCWAQNPSPPVIKIGRRAGAPQQVITLTPEASPVTGDVYTLVVTGVDALALGSQTATTDSVDYTVIAADTPTDVCDGLRAALAALNGAAGQDGDFADGGTATLTITASNTHATVDGTLFGVVVSTNLTVTDDTPVPAIPLSGATGDLTLIELYDPDWYGLCIDSNSELEIIQTADWISTTNKQFVCQTQDVGVASLSDSADDPTTGSVAAQLKGSTRERTMLFFHRNPKEYVCAAMLGRALPEDAGSITWAYKQLSSVTAQSLTTTELEYIEAKNANSVTTLAGVSITRFGTASSGEYMDVMRGTDWLAARIQERTYALLIQNDKVPYTDSGINAVKSEILAQLQAGVARDFLSPDPEPTCTVPRASEVSAADKGSRTLNNVTFRATLAGAVHKVNIEGELNL